ncbi:MAG TPA: tRNA preQ1(34) S-adenosylmethionine ribosyltransferase-isomerase QueA [Anaerolineaceae bacterium]|jgi:S-adenosylmethionine:tRNA ribosyltransferase-isomerase|nr:tRNA preQ1(34) S-adenosylmethionine ribosyltransferase-isomerase QueA [Anaerolineaceae bacterium]NMC17311.1 tRNA preQ1(34) S-adenosylmethionine ribosyltransferase-isomerase QueA [Chloroflexota bacterium]HNS06722.1 tRNA preQ1(34) S-adenosylmethionine ribosyltransferase-isomerase QueA [Anaerolineaceae bacterium]HOE03456.1 tRNA preQ1(34) S-adenosylmethionine ribosyltransferase-isomerase QueA [Anaerolineaceae bacterium]HOQ68905.1 tRNA preQ1(34) S-adenosylmethionine ribosyltransferase-isomerase Q
MQTADFDYHLPPEYIAQTPIEPRHASRLLVLRRSSATLEDSHFCQLPDFLNPGDLLVINQTKVIPARLHARKTSGGKVELLLLKQREPGLWEALAGGKGLRKGVRVQLENGPYVDIEEELTGSERLIRFSEPVEQLLPTIGEMPLPPYIHEKLLRPDRYQTVYATETGSAAAPTAGLHFTPWLMDEIERKGVRIAKVTLHVGLDTFAPVTELDPVEHKIHTEWCELTEEAALLINRTKASGGRVVAVGTTSVRTLESAAATSNQPSWVAPYRGQTGLFILPGFEFKVVDALVTNFHLPKSTLLMLVSAFAGRERVLDAYQAAMERGYRFYSFGDAMLIL